MIPEESPQGPSLPSISSAALHTAADAVPSGATSAPAGRIRKVYQSPDRRRRVSFEGDVAASSKSPIAMSPASDGDQGEGVVFAEPHASSDLGPGSRMSLANPSTSQEQNR